MTPSPDASEVHEISDISSSHIVEIEEDIRISDIKEKFCCTSMQTFTESISDYGAPAFALNRPSASLPLITCSSSHRTSKEEDFLHLPGHLLLTLGDVLTTHGLLFMAATYQFLECSSHSLISQEPFLTFHLTSVALHGSSLHPAALYISDLVEHIILLPKRKIPPDIMMERFTCQAPGYLCTEEPN